MPSPQPSPLPRAVTVLAAALLLGASRLGAQEGAPPLPGRAELRRCVALAESRQPAEARAAGLEATAQLEAHLAREPRDVDAIVALARATSQCLLPAASFIEQGELSGRALELLDRALAIDSTHWTARFTLAAISFRSPPFLGRGRRAAQELDVLLAQQGARTDEPRFARTFEMRGLLWLRDGAPDSARAVWARGAALFPADTALARLLASPPAAPPARSSAAPAPSTLGAVRVVARRAAPASAAQPSTQLVERARVLEAPGGTADVLQAVQMQPGATRVGEGSDVYARGGDASETPWVVNGGRVLPLSRFEGLNGAMFGALDPFVVQAVRFSSGGFSARHGNALSGVLEIETDGRPRERQFRAGASLVQVGGTARLPASPRAGGWVSGRMSHTGPLLATHGRTAEFDGAPQSQELVASVVAQPTPLSEVRALGLVERDASRRIVSAAGWRGPFGATSASRALQVASRWVPSGAPLVLRANLTGSARDAAWTYGVLSRDRAEGAATARADAEWSPGGVVLRGGVEAARLTRRDEGTVPTTAQVGDGAPSRALDGETARAAHRGAWVEGELARGAAVLTLGARVDRLPGESRATADPRAALALRRGAWTARVGGGVFHQGRWRALPAIPDAGMPSGLARRATHLVGGIEREGATTTLRAETFEKRYGAYAPFGAGPAIADGRARGVDVLAQRRAGRATGWLAYSLLDAEVRLADGRRARSPFDVTHSATAATTVALGGDWSVGLAQRYGTGAPLTPVLRGERGEDGRWRPVYGAPTSARLPAYARLDARVMRHVRAPAFLLTSFVEVLNVADRRNASGLSYDATYARAEPVHAFFARRTIVAGAEVQWR